MEMNNAIPEHVAIIMDGNRRWAKENNSKSIVGHKKGLDTAEKICIYSSKIGIKYLTLYAFSAQNWSRSKVEIDSLFTLFLEFFNMKSNFFMKYKMKFNPIGRIDELDTSIIDKISTLVEKTKNNKGMCVNVAINYGGELLRRWVVLMSVIDSTVVVKVLWSQLVDLSCWEAGWDGRSYIETSKLVNNISEVKTTDFSHPSIDSGLTIPISEKTIRPWFKKS